jgi:hypothetical protein
VTKSATVDLYLCQLGTKPSVVMRQPGQSAPDPYVIGKRMGVTVTEAGERPDRIQPGQLWYAPDYHCHPYRILVISLDWFKGHEFWHVAAFPYHEEYGYGGACAEPLGAMSASDFEGLQYLGSLEQICGAEIPREVSDVTGK